MKNKSISSFKTSAIRLFFTIALLIPTVGTYAQTPFPDDVDDVPAAPINDWIIPFAILGCALGCYFLSKKIANSNITQ